jgi:hypothetical protein
MKKTKDSEVHLNTAHYAVSVKENSEGNIIDVFHRHGDLIESYTYWNNDVIDSDNVSCPNCGGLVKYVTTSDHWECDSCNFSDMFRPGSSESCNKGDKNG